MQWGNYTLLALPVPFSQNQELDIKLIWTAVLNQVKMDACRCDDQSRDMRVLHMHDQAIASCLERIPNLRVVGSGHLDLWTEVFQ